MKNLIESLNGIILKIIGYVMKFAPLGVFALMADLVVSFAGDSICCWRSGITPLRW